MKLTPEQQYKLCHALWERGLPLQATFEQLSSLALVSGPTISIDILDESTLYRYDLSNEQNAEFLMNKYKIREL